LFNFLWDKLTLGPRTLDVSCPAQNLKDTFLVR